MKGESMVPMLRRLLQILLVIFGVLSVLVAIFTLHISSASAATGFFQALGQPFKTILYLFIGLISFLGAYRLGKRQSAKSGRPPSSTAKG